MPIVFLPFTGLAPATEHGSDLLRCENVLPALGGLRSLPKATDDGFVTGRLNSAYVHHYPSGSGTAAYTGDAATEFFGAQTQLFTYAGGTFTNRTGALVLSGNAAAWRFASFGNDVWAVDFVDPPARRVANAGNFVAGGASTFIPEARFLGPVREFMVMAALSNAGRFEDEFAWSDANDATWYDVANATRPTSLAGSKRIVSSPGQIMGFVGGEYGVFWKRNSMHALQFTGGSDIWRLDELSRSVGTPCPSSIISCRDGFNRFWGGDGFYQQGGIAAPERIAGDPAVLLIDREAYLNDVSLRPLASFSDMGEEDGAMFGVEDPELGGVFWFYRGEADDPAVGNNRWVYYNYRAGTWALGLVTGVNFTCAAASRNFLSTATAPPRFIVGATFDNAASESHHFRFQGATNYAITLATQRFAIGKEGAPHESQHVKIVAAQPHVTPRQGTYGDDYRLATLPSNLAVRVVGALEPHFQQQVDTQATPVQVSPRSSQRTVANANPRGWLPVGPVEGYDFLLELTVPESATALRGLLGCWIWYEVVG